MASVSAVHEATPNLPASSLIDAQPACPVCGFTGARRPLFVLQHEPRVESLQCPRCHGASASKMPAPEFLRDYYARYYAGSDQAVTFRNVARFARHLERGMHLRGSVRILDFGGGDGSVAIAVAQRLLDAGHATTVGITVVDYCAPRATSDPRIAIAKAELASVTTRFDLVLASAILEHVPFLQGTIERLFEAVAPGGWFYARTPYGAPIKRVHPRYDMLFPQHVHDLGIGFWSRALATFGLAGTLEVSRPSIVETRLAENPVRSAIAYLAKLPAQLQVAVVGTRSTRLVWPFVGGWEVVIRRDRASGTTRS